MKSFMMLALAMASILGFAACGGGTAKAPPEKIIITAIPDDNAENMREYFGAIAKVVQDATGIPTEYEHVQDYSASVTALATGQAHMSWFGAVTTAQAYMQMKDDMVIVGCRDIDKTFISYYIAGKDSGVPKVNSLKELADHPNAKDWTLSFGSKSSTSSHMMPRSFFQEQAGKKPEDVFSTVAFSGSHDVVIQKVANGEFSIGTVGQPPYDRASAEDKEKAPIIYTTPTFMNYCFAARTDLGEELIGKIRAALLDMHNTEEGKKALGYLKAARFEEAHMDDWMSYVKLIESGVDIGS